MALLKDVHPFIAEVLDGKHDEILRSVEAAVTHRRKVSASQSGIRPGARIRLVDDPSNGKYAGREGIVRKVNPKSISLDLACPTCGSATETRVGFDQAAADNTCKGCFGVPEGLRVGSAKQLELVTS